jgi:hypothetical protein
MIHKLIFCVLLSSFSLYDHGAEELLSSAYAQQKKPVPKAQEIDFPDGLVGRRYNFVLTPENLVAPYKISIVSGSLPQGIALNQRMGGIEGEPTQAGQWQFTLQVLDAKGKKGLFAATIRIWRMLTVGEHGTFKGFDGLQMAINMAQDMDEIRIERGTIEASGLVVPQSKAWKNGIKISGGWNETFQENSNNPEETVLDGKQMENRILSISNSEGVVWIENLTFRDSKGGAVTGKGTFTNCMFTNNSITRSWLFGSDGGAFNGDGAFTNCTFTSNSASNGGAVSGGGTFTNCTFTSNSSSGSGGAVDPGGTFTNCTFTSNSAMWGGAVSARSGGGTFSNCTFTSNSAASSGGAVSDGGTFTNCTFTSNSTSGSGGAVDRGGTFTNCTLTTNSASDGGAVRGTGSFFHCTFYGNKAKGSGGAFSGGGKIINSIFYKNTAAEKDNDITVGGNLEIDFSLLNYLSGAANFGANNIMGDPKFVDPDNGDFRLRSDSPCIGKGKPLPELKDLKDLDGKPLVVGKSVNIGAYPLQSISADLSPSIKAPSGGNDGLRKELSRLQAEYDEKVAEYERKKDLLNDRAKAAVEKEIEELRKRIDELKKQVK